MDEVVIWRFAFGALLAMLAYFIKGMIERLEKGNEQIALIHVDVAKILVKLDNQDEKIERLESENEEIRKRVHLLSTEVTILKNKK